jgi:prepilin-type N-terminal cleavage/methylation domain-containing protein
MAVRRLRGASLGGPAGFSLVELLVAAAIIGVVLTASFGWVWSVGALAGRVDDAAQAATLVAAASRAVAAEVHAAVGVDPPGAGRDPSCSLVLVHDHVATAAESVVIVWDPARDVLWRNASGTYLADHVTRFGVAYVLTDGRIVAGASIAEADWTAVGSLRIEISTGVGSASATRSLELTVGPA